MQLLDGKTTSVQWLAEFQNSLKGLGLGIVLVGHKPASEKYVAMKIKKAKDLGVEITLIRHDETVKKEIIIHSIKELNKNPSIQGILVQLPLPYTLKEYTREILDTIASAKDVDCLSSVKYNEFLEGRAILPATPRGILELLHRYSIPLHHKNIVVIGASLLVGKPLATALEKLGAHVTICDEHTTSIRKYTQNADIVCSAAGHPGLIQGDDIKEGVIIIDIGTTVINGRLLGDVDFDSVAQKAQYITPVPGGVGPMTITALLHNLSVTGKALTKAI